MRDKPFWQGEPCPFCKAPVPVDQCRATLTFINKWPEKSFMSLSETQTSAAACLAALTYSDDLPRIRMRMRELIDHGSFVS